ncbi:Capsular polysaccharide biosynthesis glycosyl transferase [Flavobacterium cauense R2A-7]|uniref:Glycosyltransferase involved in cell wall biosynthesis n=1 Tax=Flavobacterium cauense R2A-7 TaxID=1341154 RepID=V6S291_9FLAO|nr:glycosyltransferase family 4 protein [Flavobacterium cauense]ESU20816.1 Capsular polysaccharide biosynthesis glycosyl transferase [Flavobacterium cauense R2A-7]KGO82819.1 glycosyl transferase family 1 [Flavobacterium cauense R2A-7]TWI12157.1 glycosyltransferase involved in cell wall biosynthesis [Flavobacterium cauense R2A-7]
MKKLIRITTIPLSLEKLLENQLRFMNDYYEVTAVSSEKERLKAFGENQGVKTHEIAMTRQITPLQDLKSLWQLFWFLKSEKPFIVHSHTPKAGTIGMMAAKLAGVPNRLHTVAGLPLLETTGSKRKLLSFVEKITYACATKVYPNSNGLKDIIIKEKFCNSNKLKVIGNGSSNGINTDFFSPQSVSEGQIRTLKTQLAISEDTFVFVFVGRIVADKGINELIAAFTKLLAEHKKCKLLLVGPLEKELDPLLPETEATILTSENILSVGYQNDVRPYFAISDCLVFPSYREGFPNVVMQAGAMELPAIVSNINGCNEIIVSGENGILIEPKSAEAVYQAMKSILEDNELTDRLKNNARHRIVSRYQQQVVWEAILKEYKSLEGNV